MFLLQKCSASKRSNSVANFFQNWKSFFHFLYKITVKKSFLLLTAFTNVIIFIIFPHGANRKVLRHDARTTLEGRRYRQLPEPEMETVVQNPQFAKFASLYFKEGPCHKLLTNLCNKFGSFSMANCTKLIFL
jgi:hypothetical protein